jgi:ectoine hydroxylase-related dioxygenase (phytanoyl-CoA dioxygenase family)
MEGVCATLPKSAIESYHINGFYTWQSFLTNEKLQTLRSNVQEILKVLHPTCDPEWIQHIHQLESGKWMLEFASSIKPLAAKLLNDSKPILYSSQIAVRLPGFEKTPWHQDGPGANVCTFWITLDHIDANNGGLQVMPGKHYSGRLQLKKVENEQDLPHAIKMASHNVFEIQPESSSSIFKYRLRAGGAGVHHDSLPHCANSNSTKKSRRVIILRYMNSKNERKSGKFVHYLTGEYVERNYVELL